VRAVVPAVLLGETAPVDASDQAESTVDGSDTTMPHAPASDIVDVDAGAPYSQTRSSTLGHALHHKAFWIRSNYQAAISHLHQCLGCCCKKTTFAG